MHPKHNILGIQISSISMSNLLDDFAGLIRSSSKASVCITPVNSILAARKNAQVLAIYNNANYTLCDGVPVLWASRFLGTPIEQRITGLDLLPALLEFCATNNFSLFFLGASPGVGDALKAKAEQLYPSINIKGVYCPPFAAKFEKEENDKKIVMKYIKQYDNETIRQALDGQLEISPTLLEVLNSHYNVKKIDNQ